METPPEMFSDPPDASPQDIWGDPSCLESEGQGPSVSLPPKRVKADKSGGSAVAVDGGGGLRIGTRNSSDPAARAFTRLEVLQIDGEVVRLHPEEPEVGRMPRHVVFHEKSDRVNESEVIEETRDWGKSKKQPVLWFLVTGGATASLVVGAILALPQVNKSNAARPGEAESGWVVETVADGEAMADMLSRKTEAGRVFRNLLTAPSAEAMLPLVRNPGAVADLIRADRRMPRLAPDFPPLATGSWTALENQSLTCGVLSGTLPDYSKFETYFTVSDGSLVMDWKASTAYGTADFSQLMRKQGNPEEIRGWIEPSGLYTLAFSENNYQAYQLASPDKQQLIWAYARWGSPVHQALKALIKGGYILESRSEAQKVTVRLKPGPGDSLPNQWEIVELLHKEWIAP
jgi:hypothetical protein